MIFLLNQMKMKMLNENYLNILDEEEDTPLYRIFSWTRLLETFCKNKLALVRPSKWDDPFENYFLKKTEAIQDNDNKRKFYSAHKNSLYGQCWSLHGETDAMWRIYSPDKNGVKVKTTIGKLLEELQIHTSLKKFCFIGKVEYFKEEIILDRFDEYKNLFNEPEKDFINLAKSLLLKRVEFNHEREVRLIHYHTWINGANDVISFEVDPILLFDEIVFDPRMSDLEYEEHKYFLQSKFNYERPIKKSQLYTLPDLNV